MVLFSGGCPHAAIREDISANLGALEELQADYNPEMLFVESGGDNLAANYSRELADYIIYVSSAKKHGHAWTDTVKSFFVGRKHVCFFGVLSCSE